MIQYLHIFIFVVTFFDLVDLCVGKSVILSTLYFYSKQGPLGKSYKINIFQNWQIQLIDLRDLKQKNKKQKKQKKQTNQTKQNKTKQKRLV